MKSQNGMTLIEIMVVMVIISIALIPMMHMFTFNFQTLSTSKEKYEAILKAQEILEREKNNINTFASNLQSSAIYVRKEDGFISEITVSQKDILYTIAVKVYNENQNVQLITKVGNYHE
ncbi:prepilin-type N-terminal cleavage/methylation domain-containing protein [Desulfonispora thiosulfatigenes DSM 11270]|uniref:Prepilin-type N-terminal cleavage/methylation domain-containing protein n=1 Tax=Desulfonispora thiosulfatigenes DSM 11270 TaxID=656914 RepID=A0A1W1VMZ6_DESTI|nr:prepilin-type N-terminal cleavage/methylation domain-containing protein [Desulfonispora thiosulfatigenes]SMB94727.1 prepilin-type N-terminal cleavage/methylation domain-containing protein [Desulfonispora thiosulfatigenes DSM 11270]